jgi:hypothetical protein
MRCRAVQSQGLTSITPDAWKTAGKVRGSRKFMQKRNLKIKVDTARHCRQLSNFLLMPKFRSKVAYTAGTLMNTCFAKCAFANN